MTNRNDLPNAKLIGFQAPTKDKLVAQVYGDRARSKRSRADLAAKMRARIQQRTPGQ